MGFLVPKHRIVERPTEDELLAAMNAMGSLGYEAVSVDLSALKAVMVKQLESDDEIS